MKANFKPTLLASVIAAAIYAQSTYAAPPPPVTKYCNDDLALFKTYDKNASENYPDGAPYTIDNTASDSTGLCTYSRILTGYGGNASVNIAGTDATFNAELKIERPDNHMLDKGKGVITLGNTGNARFEQPLTITDTTNQKSARLLHNRNKVGIYTDDSQTPPKVVKTSYPDQGVYLKNNTNLTISTTAEPYLYTGAAIANYNNFVAEGSGYTTTIANTGKVNGINQYAGKMTFAQKLVINSNISEAKTTDSDKNERQNAALFINSGKASFNNEVEITESKKGAGIALVSYKPHGILYGFSRGTGYQDEDTLPQAEFNNKLEIKSNDGSAIQLGYGSLAHTFTTGTEAAKITVDGLGHGIEIPENAGGKLSNNKTQSSYNWIQLAGGIIPDDYKSTKLNPTQGQHKLAIGLGEKATITTADGDGINIANVPEGNINTIVIHNKGKIHAKGSDADAIDLSAMNSPSKTTNPDLDSIRKITITNDKGSLLADSGYLLKGSAYNETFKSTDGELKGKIGMGDGSDNVTITGSDISGVTLFDGGDDTNTKDTWIDTLNLNGVTYTNSGSNISNWENINLGNQTTLNLTGTLITGKGDETGVPTQSTGLTINNGARLNVGTATDRDVTIEGKVTNSGTIDLSVNDSNPVQSLTIKGDYTGNNGTIIFDGLLKDDVNSKADSLTIEGNTDGKTNVVVKPTNPGDTGGATNQGIKLISVGGNSNQSHFTLQNPVQLTAYEYNILHYNPSNKVFFLQSKKNPSGGKKPVEVGKPKPAGSGNSNNANTTHSNTAYKPVDKPSKKIPDSVDTTPIPDVNNGDGSGSYKPELYRPAVATYSMVQFSNQDAINSLLGDQLHQRVGEQEVLRWDDKEAHDNQVWGRIRHNQLKLNGKKQFEVKQNTQLVQFGWDLDVHRNDQNSRQHSGLFAGFARANAEVSDRDRAFTEYGAFSGKVKGDIFNIGAYHTRYDEQGNYLDVIGGVHFVGNQYNDVYGSSSKQRGWGLSASVEGGMPFAIGDSEHWFVEPQAQLSWQMTQYKKFDDAVTSIDGYTSQSLRPRLGVRVGYNDKSANPEQRSKDFYATASFVRELLDPAKVNIGGVNVTEKVNNDTWVEVGLGGQLPIGKSTYIYGSAQYQHTIGSDARSGVNGQIGVRYSW